MDNTFDGSRWFYLNNLIPEREKREQNGNKENYMTIINALAN